jgi:hypothetical protein
MLYASIQEPVLQSPEARPLSPPLHCPRLLTTAVVAHNGPHDLGRQLNDERANDMTVVLSGKESLTMVPSGLQSSAFPRGGMPVATVGTVTTAKELYHTPACPTVHCHYLAVSSLAFMLDPIPLAPPCRSSGP